MIETEDLVFASELERFIRKALSGDDKELGLYRTVLSSATWDAFNITRGRIQGYEIVLAQMREIARHMNEPRARGEGGEPRAIN